MRFLDETEVMDAKAVHRRHDVAYIPKPNVVDAVVSGSLLDPSLNPTAFAFVFTPDGALVLANNRRRGPEVAGGHIEPGETAAQGAVREAREETGALLDGVFPVGFFRSVTEAERPEGYRYPHPVSCQQFFAAVTDRFEAYSPNDECLEPITLSPAGAKETLREAEYVLYSVALRRLFPALAEENGVEDPETASGANPCDDGGNALGFQAQPRESFR